MPRSASPNPIRQEAGFKAALNNPRVSGDAKEHARHVLEDQFGDEIVESGGQAEQRTQNNVARGLKAATHNPLNTDAGRQQARQKLEDMGQAPPE